MIYFKNLTAIGIFLLTFSVDISTFNSLSLTIAKKLPPKAISKVTFPL